MNLSLLVLVVAATIQYTNAQQQCEDLQYLNNTSNECLALPGGKGLIIINDNNHCIYFTP